MLTKFGRAHRLRALLVELCRRGHERELRAIRHFDIGEETVRYVVAEFGGEPVGFGVIHFESDALSDRPERAPLVRDLYVAPNLRGRGIGSRGGTTGEDHAECNTEVVRGGSDGWVRRFAGIGSGREHRKRGSTGHGSRTSTESSGVEARQRFGRGEARSRRLNTRAR